MTAEWKNPITNKNIWKYFLSGKAEYWRVFTYGRKKYLMTFNNLYEVL